jgi:hypothetical protein
MRTELPSFRATRWALTLVCALALGLRVYGLNYGLPDVHNPDEIPILNRALAFAKGDLDPKNFLYPTLYFYVLFAWEGLFFIAGRLAGLYGSVSAFEREFFVDPSHLVLAGRALTATFGVLSVAAVYQFGARLYDRATGLGAALLLAVAPFAVRDAHYIKHDVPVTLFVVLTEIAVARLVVEPSAAARRSSWLWAGAMSGLALSTHYYAFPVVISIAAAACIDGARTARWRTSARMLAWAGAGSVAAFLATTPFLLIDFKIAIRDMVAVRQIDMDRAVAGAGAFTSLGAYLRMLATDAIGWPVWLGAGVGFIVALVADWRRGVVLLCFPLVFFAFLANTVPMSRYVNPMLPSLAVAAAFALKTASDLVFGRGAELRAPKRLVALAGWHATIFPAGNAGFTVLIALAAIPGIVGSLRADRFYLQADTRTLAREFIERSAPSGSTVLVQPHGVQLRTSRDALVEALRAHLGSESLAPVKFQKQIDAARGVSPSYRILYLGTTRDGGTDPDKFYVAPDSFGGPADQRPLGGLRVAYVAVNQYNVQHSVFGSLQTALRREGRLVATFSPYRDDVGSDRRGAVAPFFHNTADRIDPALERPGPIVEIWRIE